MASLDAPHNDATSRAEGPVSSMMTKRLRALKKKLNRIHQLEEQVAAGKAINADQEEVLKTKPSLLTLIDEYERLRQPIITAVQEELAAFEKEFQSSSPSETIEEEIKEATKEEFVETEKEAGEKPSTNMDQEIVDNSASIQSNVTQNAVLDVVQLLYFASLFDLNEFGEGTVARWRAEQERNSCLSYDPVTDDNIAPLTDKDLKSMSEFGRILRTRTLKAKNHREAVNLCLQNALNWIHGSETPISENLPISYSYLKERVGRILSSDFFTLEFAGIEPEVAAVAAASGEYLREGDQPILAASGNIQEYAEGHHSGQVQAYYSAPIETSTYLSTDSFHAHEGEGEGGGEGETISSVQLLKISEQSLPLESQVNSIQEIASFPSQEEHKDAIDKSAVIPEVSNFPEPHAQDNPLQQTLYPAFNQNQRGFRGRGGRFGGRGRSYYAVRGTVTAGRGTERGTGRIDHQFASQNSNGGYPPAGEDSESDKSYREHHGDVNGNGEGYPIHGGGGGNQSGGENYGRGGYGPGRFNGRSRGRRGMGVGRGLIRGSVRGTGRGSGVTHDGGGYRQAEVNTQ